MPATEKAPTPVLLDIPWNLLRWIANTPDVLAAMTRVARNHPSPLGWRWEVRVMLFPIRYAPTARGPHYDQVIIDEMDELDGLKDPPDTSWATTAEIRDKASWADPEPASVELFHGEVSQFGPGKVHLAHHNGAHWTARCRDYPGYLMPMGTTEDVTCKQCRKRFL